MYDLSRPLGDDGQGVFLAVQTLALLDRHAESLMSGRTGAAREADMLRLFSDATMMLMPVVDESGAQRAPATLRELYGTRDLALDGLLRQLARTTRPMVVGGAWQFVANERDVSDARMICLSLQIDGRQSTLFNLDAAIFGPDWDRSADPDRWRPQRGDSFDDVEEHVEFGMAPALRPPRAGRVSATSWLMAAFSRHLISESRDGRIGQGLDSVALAREPRGRLGETFLPSARFAIDKRWLQLESVSAPQSLGFAKVLIETAERSAKRATAIYGERHRQGLRTTYERAR
jgi:hypothetical protein